MDWTTQIFFEEWDKLSKEAEKDWSTERGYYALAIYCGTDFFPELNETTTGSDFLKNIETGIYQMNFFLKLLLPESSTFWSALRSAKERIMSRKKRGKSHHHHFTKTQSKAHFVKEIPTPKPKEPTETMKATEPDKGPTKSWEEKELNEFLALYDNLNKNSSNTAKGATSGTK